MSEKRLLDFFISGGKRFFIKCSKIYTRFLLMERISDIRYLLIEPFEVVKPGLVSPVNAVPEHIVKPYYCYEKVRPPSGSPIIKTKHEIEDMRLTCKLAKKILNAAENFIQIGITTDELDKFVHNLTIQNSAYPSPLLYLGFPKSICTSVNNVACHGIPDNRKLKNGDVITVDVTLFRNGFHGDCAATFLVGDVDENGKILVDAAKESLQKTIQVCGPGQPMSVIGKTVTTVAASFGYYVLPAVCGHGIGRDFHESPEVMHSSYSLSDDDNTIMVPGMTFTIEPVICQSTENVEILEDGWTVVSENESLCAQFEHTILITQTGCEILTQ